MKAQLVKIKRSWVQIPAIYNQVKASNFKYPKFIHCFAFSYEKNLYVFCEYRKKRHDKEQRAFYHWQHRRKGKEKLWNFFKTFYSF